MKPMIPVIIGVGVALAGVFVAIRDKASDVMSARQQVVSAAESQLGPGNPVLYWEDVCVKTLEPNKDWCGAFVLWCLHRAGLALDVCWATDGSGFVGGQHLPTTKTPLPGDIYYQHEPYQHHAIVESLENGILTTIDGNSPNVSRNSRPVPKEGILFYSIDPLLKKAGYTA